MKFNRKKASPTAVELNVTTWVKGVEDRRGFVGAWNDIWLAQDAPFWLLTDNASTFDATMLENRLISTVKLGLLSGCCRTARVHDERVASTVCFTCRTPMPYVHSIDLFVTELVIGSNRPAKTYVKSELPAVRAYLLKGLDDDPRLNVLKNELIVDEVLADALFLAELVVGDLKAVQSDSR